MTCDADVGEIRLVGNYRKEEREQRDSSWECVRLDKESTPIEAQTQTPSSPHRQVHRDTHLAHREDTHTHAHTLI